MTCDRAPSGAVTHTRGVVSASPAKRYFGSALEEIHRNREHGRVREQKRHLAPPPPAHGRRGADARHRHELPRATAGPKRNGGRRSFFCATASAGPYTHRSVLPACALPKRRLPIAPTSYTGR